MKTLLLKIVLLSLSLPLFAGNYIPVGDGEALEVFFPGGKANLPSSKNLRSVPLKYDLESEDHRPSKTYYYVTQFDGSSSSLKALSSYMKQVKDLNLAAAHRSVKRFGGVIDQYMLSDTYIKEVLFSRSPGVFLWQVSEIPEGLERHKYLTGFIAFSYFETRAIDFSWGKNDQELSDMESYLQMFNYENHEDSFGNGFRRYPLGEINLVLSVYQGKKFLLLFFILVKSREELFYPEWKEIIVSAFAPAIGFYQKLGFKPVEAKACQLQPGSEIVLVCGPYYHNYLPAEQPESVNDQAHLFYLNLDVFFKESSL